MDESDASTHDDEDGRRTDGSLARIRLWTRAISSQLQDPVNVDEAPVTGRITDLSSIVARTYSPPTPITPNNRNATRQSNHVNQSNGQSARASVQFSDRVERSRYLAAKYGIDLIEPEWARPVREQVQRVERSIRMRIRYWCHHCNTQYTNSRICSQCSHQRCNRCERQPPRRTTPRFRLADANRTNYILSTENLYVGSIGEHVPNTTLPISQSPSTAFVPQPYANSSRDPFGRRTEAVQGLQQEAVTSPGRLEPHPGRINKPFRVRVHYTCHECQNPFPPKESNCSACGHELCKDCPRNPPRREHRRTSPDNKALERVLMPLGSASDDDDEDGKGKPKIPRSRVQSPPPPSTMIEGIRTRDTAVEPAEPPPPV